MEVKFAPSLGVYLQTEASSTKLKCENLGINSKERPVAGKKRKLEVEPGKRRKLEVEPSKKKKTLGGAC